MTKNEIIVYFKEYKDDFTYIKKKDRKRLIIST